VEATGECSRRLVVNRLGIQPRQFREVRGSRGLSLSAQLADVRTLLAVLPRTRRAAKDPPSGLDVLVEHRSPLGDYSLVIGTLDCQRL